MTKATLISREGLLALARKNGRPVCEEAVTQINKMIERGVDGNLVSLEDVVAAANELNPGDLYTRGLEAIAGTTKALRNAAVRQTENMAQSGSEEHIAPTKSAFRFLTGKEL